VNEILGSAKDENFVSSRMAVGCEAGLICGSLTK